MYFSSAIIDKYCCNPEGFADFCRRQFYNSSPISYPIDPFSILNDLGIHYSFRNLDKLEGLLLADNDGTGINLIVINSKRPIQRIRYSCVHELCHFLKDVGDSKYDPWKCISKSTKKIERYAEDFAAAFLMPKEEVKKIVQHINKRKLTCDDILRIADYFGVSFQSCLVRLQILEPSIVPDSSESKKYKPRKRREKLGLNDTVLIEQVINSWEDAWYPDLNTRAAYVYKNDYIYNDSRLEGIDISQDLTSEIVTDLRLFSQDSVYCSSMYHNYAEIAGHSVLYDRIFNYPQSKKVSIYTISELHRLLFSCVPFPEFGGKTRTHNTLVLGAKFETVDYRNVMRELILLDTDVQFLEKNNSSMAKSEVIKEIVKIHYRLTVIHPFADGNGRTSRAFMNLLLTRYGLPPIYIATDKKDEYIKLLNYADANGTINALYNFFLKEIIPSHSNFHSLGS